MKSFKNLGFFIVNGVIAILFGILLLTYTQEVIDKIVFFFGLLILIGGVILLIAAIRNLGKNKSVFWPMLQSVLIIAVGLIIMFFPKNSLDLFLVVIGVWAILSGIVQLVVLVNLGTTINNKNVFLVNGLLTIVLGVILIVYPPELAAFIAKVIGIFSILFGLVVIYLAFAVRSALKKSGDTPSV